VRLVFSSLNLLFERCPYSKDLFIDLEGESLIDTWLEHPNKDVRRAASDLETLHFKSTSLEHDPVDQFFSASYHY
jgi:hypothetical protein